MKPNTELSPRAGSTFALLRFAALSLATLCSAWLCFALLRGDIIS